MTATLALAGDTMLGRGVGDRLAADPDVPLVAPEVAARIAGADAAVFNLECCISSRGDRFPDPRKPFFFRAPPIAARRLADLGVTAVTLANNHALDYGPTALLDTLAHLEDAGIAVVGAGSDDEHARAPVTIPAAICGCGSSRCPIIRRHSRPGRRRPASRSRTSRPRRRAGRWRLRAPDPTPTPSLVTPHWGPNMVAQPVARARRAAADLVAQARR
jgi:poly-gamma-glutamate synthesis protein (capsule biosynthesis protein)